MTRRPADSTPLLLWGRSAPRIFTNERDLSPAASSGVMFKKREPILVFVNYRKAQHIVFKLFSLVFDDFTQVFSFPINQLILINYGITAILGCREGEGHPKLH